jgi:hypothetical protein
VLPDAVVVPARPSDGLTITQALLHLIEAIAPREPAPVTSPG